MNKQNFDINSLRVASPCSVGWETMSGDERVRRCNSCELNIYNIAEMTKNEVESLITNREDRVCIRLYRRADGTVLTKDCPVGFRAYQKRVARFAGAALAAILGLFSVSFGQKNDEIFTGASKVNVVNSEQQKQTGVLRGVVRDSAGAIIPSAQIRLYKENSKKALKTKSDDDGKYIFNELAEGQYTLEVKFKGFMTHKRNNLMIKNGFETEAEVELYPSQKSITIGIYAEEPLIDTTSSSVTTKITREMIDKLPH